MVDYGLAYRYRFDGGRLTEYKEDPRRVHDGTIEFTSRDAHRGVRKRIFNILILVINFILFTYFILLTKPLGMQASIFGACPKPG